MIIATSISSSVIFLHFDKYHVCKFKNTKPLNGEQQLLYQNATQCHLRLSNSQFNLPSNCWVFRCRTSNLLQEYFYFKRWLLLQNIPPPKTGHVRCSRKCIEIQFHRHSMMRGLKYLSTEGKLLLCKEEIFQLKYYKDKKIKD